MIEDHRIAVIIPALNEQEALGEVLDAIPAWVDRILVADNGSTDATAQVARNRGAEVVTEPRRGYGAACLASLRHLAASGDGGPDIIVFLDGDRSDYPEQMGRLTGPIIAGEADLVIGSRILGGAPPRSLTLPQRLGNRLAAMLIRRLWGLPCTDLGPFRAIRARSLARLAMDDLDFGWTVQMQVRAAKAGLRCIEVPVGYRPRIGRSKISGTVRGVIAAGRRILGTIAREAFTPPVPAAPQRLLVFTRLPRPGTTKTRLIPHLGAEGAAELQERMTQHVLTMARRWASHPGRAAQVRGTGGSSGQLAATFGHDLDYIDQGDGDLGRRLERAFSHSFKAGCTRVVAIGSDCPDVDAAMLGRAFDALEDHDVVLGPARDGGYYLIGLRRHRAGLFADIDWGGEQVLSQTRQRIAARGLSCAELAELSDVDEPADLPVWQRARCSPQATVQPPPPPRPRYSVIIPALNEAGHLGAAIASARQSSRAEVIVVDGGSEDDTPAIARSRADQALQHAASRAAQMNAGAAAASGELLIFLHADTVLPFGYPGHVEAALARPGAVAGAFRFGFDQLTGPGLRLIEAAANLRSHLLGLPYGDQALFMPRNTFQHLGGFRALPVMEDYDLVQRLKRLGRIILARATALTSARRWQQRGVWRTTMHHQRMILGWHLGVPLEKIATWHTATAGVPASNLLRG